MIIPPHLPLQAIVTRFLGGTLAVRHLSISYHPVVWPYIATDHFSDESVLTWIAHVSPSLEMLTLVDPNRISPQVKTTDSNLTNLNDFNKVNELNELNNPNKLNTQNKL